MVALALVLMLVVSQFAGTLSKSRVEPIHAFVATTADGPVRWNPCQPIHYEVNAIRGPPQAIPDLHEAIRRVSDATGIRFVEDGTTSRTVDEQVDAAFRTGIAGGPTYLPVLIEWVPHEHFQAMVRDEEAEAFAMPFRGDGALAVEYVSGLVAVDAGVGLPPGFANRAGEGVVLQHELGHVVGLAHVASPHELMWSPESAGKGSVPDVLQTDWGPGDLDGLRALGHGAGCLPARH